MIKVKISGLEDAKRAIADLSLSVRKTIAQKALLAGARIYRDDAKARTPLLKTPTLISKGEVIRKRGTARKSIIAMRSRSLTTATQVGVRVKYRQAKPGQMGARSPYDPYYVRWLELGTKKMRPFAMLQQAFRSVTPKVLARIAESLGEQIRAFNNRKR